MEWFNNLEKREQLILIGGLLAAMVLGLWSFYLDLSDERARYQERTLNAEETLVWMKQSVAAIKAAKGSGASNSGGEFANKSLSQLSELAAKRSGLRFSRFQPKGNDEAQVWFDKVAFSKLLDFLTRLELDYGVSVETMSVNAANAPGVVNARIKFAK